MRRSTTAALSERGYNSAPGIRTGDLSFQGFARRKVSADFVILAHGQPRAPVPHLVGSTPPRPYHFRALIQSFQVVAAPFPGDSGLPSASRAAIPATEAPRFKRSTIGSGSPTREPGRERPAREPRHPRVAPSSLAPGVPPAHGTASRKIEFFPHFVSFQGFAGRKISASVVTPIPVFRATGVRRSAGNDDVSHRLSRPTLTRVAACARPRRRAGLVAAI